MRTRLGCWHEFVTVCCDRQVREALQQDIRGGSGEGIYAGTGTYWEREMTSGDISHGRPRVDDANWNLVCFGSVCVDGDSMGNCQNMFTHNLTVRIYSIVVACMH